MKSSTRWFRDDPQIASSGSRVKVLFTCALHLPVGRNRVTPRYVDDLPI